MPSFAIFEVLTFFGQSLSADQLLQLRELALVGARKDKPAPGGAGQGGPSAARRWICGFQRRSALEGAFSAPRGAGRPKARP